DRSPRTAVNGIVPIGRPVGDTTARLVDDSGTPIDAAGVKGALVIGGRQLTTGYWLDPARTAQAFLPGSPGQPAEYRTGDVCFRNEVGQYVHCGRTDAQIKIAGHPVELGEIEHAVRSVTNRSAVAVVPVPDGPTNALVLFLEQPELDVAGLRTELKRLVPAYMVPRRVRWLERLPHNLSGKLDRPALASMYRAEAGQRS